MGLKTTESIAMRFGVHGIQEIGEQVLRVLLPVAPAQEQAVAQAQEQAHPTQGLGAGAPGPRSFRREASKRWCRPVATSQSAPMRRQSWGGLELRRQQARYRGLPFRAWLPRGARNEAQADMVVQGWAEPQDLLQTVQSHWVRAGRAPKSTLARGANKVKPQKPMILGLARWTRRQQRGSEVVTSTAADRPPLPSHRPGPANASRSARGPATHGGQAPYLEANGPAGRADQ